jgi:putative ABC transport system permease protein
VKINHALARLLFGDENPIGRRLVLGPDEGLPDSHEIIGVVGDVRHTSLSAEGLPHAYDLFGQHWSRTAFIVTRTQGDPYAAAALVRREVRQLDRQAPVFEARSLSDIVDDSMAARRLASSETSRSCARRFIR